MDNTELENTAQNALAFALDEDTSKQDDGLVYITRTFIVDPSKYNSPTLQRQRAGEAADIKNAGKIKKASTPTKDEMPVEDCLEVPVTDTRQAPTRETCETDISQCRAANPLFCRFHGPKLIEADIRNTLQMTLGARNRCRVAVTRDTTSDNPRAFKVTIACRPEQRETVEHALDGFLSEPGITATGDSEFDNGRMSQRYDVDLERADRAPRVNERTGHTNEPKAVAAERLNRTSPQGTIRGDGQEPRPAATSRTQTPSQVSEAGRVTAEALERAFGDAGNTTATTQTATQQPQQEAQAPAQPPQPMQNGGIEHDEGGVKARFTESEKNAIEAEKNRAIRESNANPDNADLRAYAHALSHFLGSSNSRYGQRHGALRGIRDDITKAQLLEKAERRLADTQGHPARYNGSVRALQKIAELAGLGGQIEIAGTTVRLANNAQRGEQNAQQPQQNPTETPQYTQADMDDLVNRVAEHAQFSPASVRNAMETMLNGDDFRLYLSNRGYIQRSGVPTDHPVVRNIDARMKTMIQDMGDRDYLDQLLDRELLSPYPELEEAARTRLGQLAAATNAQQSPAAPSREDLLAAGELLALDDESIHSAEEGANYLHTIINGDANGFFSQEMRANEARRILQRESWQRGAPASVRNALQSVIDGYTQNSAGARMAALARTCTTHPDNYTPNQRMSADEIRRINQENKDFWENEDSDGKFVLEALSNPRGATRGDYVFACNDLAERVAHCVPEETLRKDDENVRRLMPDVGERVGQAEFDLDIDKDMRSRPSGLFNPYLSNMYSDMNCWKGAVAVLMRLRGYPVTAREQTESSPILADSPNMAARQGRRAQVYVATMDDMTSQYERIYGSDEERTAKFREMAEGNPEHGIAPYPDGTFVMTWDGHARANLLYKGKWFIIDPYINDFLGSNFVTKATPADVSSNCMGVSSDQQKVQIRQTIEETVAMIARYGRDFRWGGNEQNLDTGTMRRRTTVLALAHYGRLSLRNGMPPADRVEEAIQKVIESGAVTRFQSSIVIRPTDTLNKGIMACCKAIPQD